MIERSMERRALPRDVINLPALLSFDGIMGLHPCVVRDINAFGARLSTPYYIFASEFDLLFSSLHKRLACRVVWRRATISGVVFVVLRRAPKPVSASIVHLNLPYALPPVRPVSEVCGISFDMH
ncbi:PilZ domain-containing protein [Bradyrhizobium sp. 142]|uniref:PilZ domain-containing protein n=1 Tax=Bradyrhizobium sp. 142 TaxID=2782618 RepID=UPI001FF92A7F|nr:PilZ domain-containing protein [Bradyrhizobium sp. 142]MCK1726826.1 PilZ domain-containing protein [Bradyrhizobium sp. 142]